MRGNINSIIQRDCQDILKNVDITQFKNSSILLTGSNGLFGRYITSTIYFANKHYQLNCKLYCTSLHEPSQELEYLFDDRNIVFIQADLSKPFEFTEKVDYIFHTACYAQPKKFLQNKLKTLSLNVDAVKSLLEIAKDNNAKFMFFSSGGVYGYEHLPEELTLISESYNGCCSTIEPRAAYCESKRLGETICSIYRNDYSVNAYIVRIGYVYGPGISIDDDRVLGNFIKKAIIDKEIRMLDEGRSVITCGYISDIIQMIFKVMLEGRDFIYNISGMDSVSIKNLAQEISKNCGNAPVTIPHKQEKDKRIGTNSKCGLDISKFIKEFGQVKFIPFSEGIRRTIAWNIEEFNLLPANKK